MSELKPCPFCGKALSLFGNDVRNGKLVEVFIHPYEVDDGWDRCPLTSLVFDLERWQLRPIEDELRAELEKRTAGLHYANAVCMEMKHELDRLKEENHALDQINRDIQTAAAHLDEVLAELARRDEELEITDNLLKEATETIGAVIACCTYNSNEDAKIGIYGIDQNAFTRIDQFIIHYNDAVSAGKVSVDVKTSTDNNKGE